MKVLIADDHPVVRAGLKALLEAHLDITVVGEARDCQEAVELARTLEWDVAVVDYWMPGQSGADLVKRIKQHQPNRPVLVLSMDREDAHATQAIKAGASGYLNKESAADELALAIRKVARGGKHMSRALAEKLAQVLTDGVECPAHEMLSHREYRIMLLMAQGKLINEISKELFLAPSTVSTYRSRILRKLKLANNAELVCYAVKNGLVV